MEEWRRRNKGKEKCTTDGWEMQGWRINKESWEIKGKRMGE